VMELNNGPSQMVARVIYVGSAGDA